MADKRIGFIDLKLENFHANVLLEAIRGPLQDRGYTVTGCHGMDDAEGRAWGTKNSVPYFPNPAELDRHVDLYMVLAPSNPEVHLPLCQKVFPFGKPCYVDKTFAPDLATAEAIFALADRHRVAVQTTSALRYTNIQKQVVGPGKPELRHMVAWGGGSSFGEYAIHPTELVLSCMGPEAESIQRRTDGELSQLLLNFSRGRTAVINVYVHTETPFAAGVTTPAGTELLTVDDGTLFTDMAAGVLDFFDAGRPVIDRKESLMIRRILDAAADPRALAGFIQL